MLKIYNVKGMACAHCKATVEKTVNSLPGVTSATVDLSAGTVTVNGTAAPAEILAAISAAGFDPSVPE